MSEKAGRKAYILVIALFFAQAAGPVHAGSLKRKVDSGRVASEEDVVSDIGRVSIDGGIVKKTFELYNGETENLVLKGAFTSCACTKAFIELPDGTTSKLFGMSLPRKWYRVIKPGERFKVHIEFDPAYHGKEGIGPFRRNVYLVTSASPDENLSTNLPVIRNGTVVQMVLTGEVLTAADYRSRHPVQTYKANRGDFQFASSEHDFGTVKQSGDAVRYDLPLRYTGDVPVTITGTPTSCGCVTASISRKVFEPGDTGVLTVRFDPNYHREPEGRFFKDVVILTDPPQPEEAGFRIWAEVNLDLGPEAYKFNGHDDEGEHAEEQHDDGDNHEDGDDHL